MGDGCFVITTLSTRSEGTYTVAATVFLQTCRQPGTVWTFTDTDQRRSAFALRLLCVCSAFAPSLLCVCSAVYKCFLWPPSLCPHGSRTERFSRRKHMAEKTAPEREDHICSLSLSNLCSVIECNLPTGAKGFYQRMF